MALKNLSSLLSAFASLPNNELRREGRKQVRKHTTLPCAHVAAYDLYHSLEEKNAYCLSLFIFFG